VILQETGEHVIICAGELHLERCVRDLREVYSKIPIKLSPPIVPFRETISNEPSLVSSRDENANPLPLGTVQSDALNGFIRFQVRALPMPQDMRSFLLNSNLASSEYHAQNTQFMNDLSSYFDNLKVMFPEIGLDNWKSRY
jgi:ribosome assembly protein 1